MDSPTFMEDDTSFGFGIDKERLGGSYVSLDDGPKSALSPPITSPPNGRLYLQAFVVLVTQIVPQLSSTPIVFINKFTLQLLQKRI